MSKHDHFLAWYGSVDQRRKMAGHANFHIRTRALASLRQLGHGDMTHEEYSALHDDHLNITMGSEKGLSELYTALVDPRVKPHHLKLAINREYKTSQGQIFQRECRKKLERLNNGDQ